jgi:DNA-binding XRE family transcriptional regulator
VTNVLAIMRENEGMTRSDPSALRWLVGVELAHFRKLAGLSIAEAVQRTGITRAKIGHMETGRMPPPYIFCSPLSVTLASCLPPSAAS